jgi:hypothetical protein
MAIFKLLSMRSARSLQIIALAVFAVCSLTYLTFPGLDIKRFKIQTDRASPDGFSNVPFASSNKSPTTALSRLAHPPPNITIIAVWNPKTSARPQAYLPNFFASIQANPKIHLLFVVFDKFQYGCDKPIAPVAKNIREICFSTENYWKVHVDYLCQRWGCTDEDEIALLETLLRRSNGDHVRLTRTTRCALQFTQASFPSLILTSVLSELASLPNGSTPGLQYGEPSCASCLELTAHFTYIFVGVGVIWTL